MKVFILAAGQGTRLRPFTDVIPKCMVSFQGKPLLQYQWEALDRVGIKDITVISGYRAEEILRQGYRTLFNRRYEQMNMVGTLFCAHEYMTPEQDLIIAYGDIIYQSDVLDAIIKADAPISVIVDCKWRAYWEMRFIDPLSDAETLKVDSDGYITEIGKKAVNYEEIQGQYIGLIKIKANMVEKIKQEYFAMDHERVYDGKNFENMYMTSFLQYLIEKSYAVKAVPISSGWLEFDSVEDLKRYNKLYETRDLVNFYHEC